MLLLSDFLNQVSQPLLGYDVAVKDDRGQILILPIGKYSFAILTSFVCLMIYMASSVFFNLFSYTYRGLPKREKMFWNLAVLRGIYGTYGAVSTFYTRYFDEHLKSHVTETRTEFSYFLVLTNLGFFIFEMLAQIYFDVHFRTFSKALFVHHTLSLVGFWTTMNEDKGHYFVLSGFVIELSTPFSCICYCLLKSGMAETFLWKANQLILIHVFHMRIMIEWRLLYDFFYYWDEFKKLSPAWYINSFLGISSLCFFLTPYWTYRKTEQFFHRADWNADEKKDQKNTHSKKKS